MVVLRKGRTMKFTKAKRKHPGKAFKIGGADRSTYDGFVGTARAAPGFSYRGRWTSEGCPGTFETWLVNKGILPKQ